MEIKLKNHKMKAQKVFENINFERGLDPKTSMDIGKREWTPDELVGVYKKLLKQFKPPVGSVYHRHLRENFLLELLPLIPKRHKTRVGWGNLDNILYILDPDEFNDIKRIILKYYNLTK